MTNHKISTQPLPTSFWPRSYWMPPYYILLYWQLFISAYFALGQNPSRYICLRNSPTIAFLGLPLQKNIRARRNSQKSVNLQYNTLVRWAMGQTTCWSIVWCSNLFFYKFLQNSLQKLLQFFLIFFFYKITRVIKSFWGYKSIRNY